MTTAPATAAADGWGVRRRQLTAVLLQELRKGLSAWRGLMLAALAFAPVGIITVHALHDRRHGVEQETLILAGIVQFYYLRFGIFFGCLAIFMRLIRGEVSERTLHYPFLAPVRREVLTIGKFLAGVSMAGAVFTAGVLASFLMMYGHFDEGREFLASDVGMSHLRAYTLVAFLACLGYGAVFLAMSLIFRNPILSAVIVLLWEGLNGILPVWLKRFSVTFYLKPLCPVEVPVEGISGLFTIVAEPTPPWLAVTGLLVFSTAVVAFACWRIRRLEISYSTD